MNVDQSVYAQFRSKLRQFQTTLREPTTPHADVITTLLAPLRYLGLSQSPTHEESTPVFSLASISLSHRDLFLERYYTGFLRCLLEQVPRLFLRTFSPEEKLQCWYPWFGLQAPITLDLHPGILPGITMGFLVSYVSTQPRELWQSDLTTPQQTTTASDAPLIPSEPLCATHSSTLLSIVDILERYVSQVTLSNVFQGILIRIDMSHRQDTGSNSTAYRNDMDRQSRSQALAQYCTYLANYCGIPSRLTNCLANDAIPENLQAIPFFTQCGQQLLQWALDVASADTRIYQFKDDVTHLGTYCSIRMTLVKLCVLNQCEPFIREYLNILHRDFDEPYIKTLATLLGGAFGQLEQVAWHSYLGTVIRVIYHRYLKHSLTNLPRCIILLHRLITGVSDSAVPGDDDCKYEQGEFHGDSPPLDRDAVVHTVIHTFILQGTVKTLVLKLLVPLVAYLGSSLEDSQKYTRQLREALLTIWCSPTFLTNTPTETIRFVTEALLLTIAQSPPSELVECLGSPAMMRGIQFFLEYPFLEIRNWGLVVAECLSARTDDPGHRLAFGLDKGDPQVQQLRELDSFTVDFSKPATISPFESDTPTKEHRTVPLVGQPVATRDGLDTKSSLDTKDLTAPNPNIVSGTPISFVSELRKIPHLTQVNPPKNSNQVLPCPVFLRQCLAYLEATDDPRKVELGLENVEDCVRRADIADLEHLAVRLVRHLLQLHDDYQTDRFTEKRAGGVVEAAVRCPKLVVPTVIAEFFERPYNLEQRCAMLAMVQQSASKLSGRQFEQNQHARQDALSHIQVMQQQEARRQNRNPLRIVDSPKISQVTELGPGKVVWSSRRLELEKDKLKYKSLPNAFLALAGPTFFFPLLGGAYSRDSLFDVSKEPLLLELYIRTLNSLLYFGAHSPYIVKMIQEHWGFIKPLIVRSRWLTESPISLGELSIVESKSTAKPMHNVLCSALIGLGIALTLLPASSTDHVFKIHDRQGLTMLAIVQGAAASLLLNLQERSTTSHPL
ncbi:telomere binding protein [Dispira simplex]|nr:telomere binding protein [Dispira simplex]